MKYIFEDLTHTETLYKLIDETCTDPKDKEHLIAVVKDTVHHEIVDMVLGELTPTQQVEFLTLCDDEPSHAGLLQKLKGWISDFELKVSNYAKKSEDNILQIIELK